MITLKEIIKKEHNCSFIFDINGQDHNLIMTHNQFDDEGNVCYNFKGVSNNQIVDDIVEELLVNDLEFYTEEVQKSVFENFVVSKPAFVNYSSYHIAREYVQSTKVLETIKSYHKPFTENVSYIKDNHYYVLVKLYDGESIYYLNGGTLTYPADLVNANGIKHTVFGHGIISTIHDVVILNLKSHYINQKYHMGWHTNAFINDKLYFDGLIVDLIDEVTTDLLKVYSNSCPNHVKFNGDV